MRKFLGRISSLLFYRKGYGSETFFKYLINNVNLGKNINFSMQLGKNIVNFHSASGHAILAVPLTLQFLNMNTFRSRHWLIDFKTNHSFLPSRHFNEKETETERKRPDAADASLSRHRVKWFFVWRHCCLGGVYAIVSGGKSRLSPFTIWMSWSRTRRWWTSAICNHYTPN